jgi:hypothetical protein
LRIQRIRRTRTLSAYRRRCVLGVAFRAGRQELAALIAGPSDWIERMPPQSRDAARAALVEAQAQWIKFRDAECHRQRTWSHASAMTPRGLMASCQLNATFHRRNELEKLYTFKPQ